MNVPLQLVDTRLFVMSLNSLGLYKREVSVPLFYIKVFHLPSDLSERHLEKPDVFNMKSVRAAIALGKAGSACSLSR